MTDHHGNGSDVIMITMAMEVTSFLSDLIGRDGSCDVGDVIMITMAMEVTSLLSDMIGRDIGDVIMVTMVMEVTSSCTSRASARYIFICACAC